MDSKIILSILIVALIGVVAASYHDQIEDMNLLSGLGDMVENDFDDNVLSSDSQESGNIIPGGTALPTISGVGGSVLNTNIYNLNNNPQHKQDNNNNNNNPSVNSSKINNNTTISTTEGYNIAKKWVNEKLDKKELKTNPIVKYLKTEDDVYMYNILDDTDKIIGYVEIDITTGAVTGGAILNEAPPVNDNVNDTSINDTDHTNS